MFLFASEYFLLNYFISYHERHTVGVFFSLSHTYQNFLYTDIQPPVMTGCQNSETILTTQPEAFASWNIPSFQDPMGRQLIVSSNYPTNSTSFPWGDFTVQYSALKPSNGLRTECNFTLSIRRKLIYIYSITSVYRQLWS